MLYQLKRFVPDSFKRAWHYALARLATIVYRHPSDEMIVIGVTGTNGKSSTVQFIAQLLEGLGETVGYTTTAGFMVAGKERVNAMKMTMPGRFHLQRLMREMVTAGCRYAIIETSSQGLDQFRHIGVEYDTAVFTNLTPEHIEAHGGFENYKRAKGKLFSALSRTKRKVIDGDVIPKTILVNGDDEHSSYYASFSADRVVRFGERKTNDVVAEIDEEPLTSTLTIGGHTAVIPFPGRFQALNVLAAVATVESLGFSLEAIFKEIPRLAGIPGRFERISIGQPFEVIVDYAYEPYALRALFDAVEALKPKRIIGVHGSAGGGRDVARRVEIGRLAGNEEAIVIVTNEDPYDEDPRAIIEAVAGGAKEVGKVEGEDLFLIDDRREAIHFALSRAKPGDVLIVTGKGSEPVMAVAGGKKIPWSDRAVVLEALKNRL